MGQSKFARTRICDAQAAALSLANHALKAVVASRSLSQHGFTIIGTKGNARGQWSAVFYDPRTQRFAATYCLHAKRAHDVLMAKFSQLVLMLRNDPRRYCRAAALFSVTERGEPYVHEADLSALATRELNRALAPPLDDKERSVLTTLMHGHAQLEAAE